jgi:CxxC motif-containing protein (DUF1111 family)
MDHNMTSRIGMKSWLVAGCVLAAVSSVAIAGGRGQKSNATMSREFYEGRELFVSIWEPGKPSPNGGDGLGPLYNEQSCVACHHLGGVGGAGEKERDVLLMTAVAIPNTAVSKDEQFPGRLEDLHPGFGIGASVVIHRHATDAALEQRLRGIQTYSEVDTDGRTLALRKSSRNTPAIFGAGLIDSIPDEILLAAEGREFARFPEIKGRVSRLPDGRLGRFGWKGQTASLREFVLAACSNELGLEVPGHHQASLAPARDAIRSEPKLDMDEHQSNLLVGYVSSLPPPVLRPIREEALPPWGYVLFEQVGCATCHTPRLGRLNGLYSDLLLHDMGQSLSDAATYYGAPTTPEGSGDLIAARDRARSARTAAMTEWRTPPLWGVADSAPYLHDGRASTLDEAIRLHDGEAARTVARYKKLGYGDRKNLVNFLLSLTAAPKSRRSPATPAKRPIAPEKPTGNS